MRTRLRSLAWLSLVALLAAAALEWRTGWLARARFEPTPALAAHAPARDAAEAQRQDLDDLAQLASLDRSFTPATRAAFTAGLARLRERAGGLDAGRFAIEVSRLVALADNGHTALHADLPRVPLRVAWFEEGLFVVRASAAQADLLGARVLSLDGRTPEQALEALRGTIGGTPEHVRSESVASFATPALLHGLWPEAADGALALRAELRGGAVVDREVATDAIGSTPSGAPLAPLLAPAPPPGGAGEWRYALPPTAALPLSLRHGERALGWEELADGELYVRLNATSDDESGPLEAQLAQLIAGPAARPLRLAIVDLRWNGGGDYAKTLAFTRALPRALAPDGVLWLLVSNDTFSAGIVTLARLRAFAGARAHIAGERIGDRDVFWAEHGAPLLLRNTGLEIGYATGMHDWVHGCRDLLRCYWPNLVHGVAAGDLGPELAGGWRYADYATGGDTLFGRVLSAARGGAR